MSAEERGVTAEGRPDGGQPKNFLRPCLLLLLKEAPAHGYDLLEKLIGFGLPRDPGGLYRTLRALEHEGLVKSRWEPAVHGRDRRAYQLTQSGEEWLHSWASALEDSRAVIDRYLDRYRAVLRPRPVPSRR
jgi:poly-beta-hydroxybutyrate-responsive repressor